MYALKGDQERAVADYNRAAALLRQAIERNPDDSGAHNDLAWTLAYYLDQDYEDALSHARRSVELEPEAYNQDTLALVYYKLGRYQKALEHYNLALSLDPEQFDSCLGRGDTYAALGQTEAALADYKTCLTLDLPKATRIALEAKVKSLQNGQGD
jgi:tetratricopeptide (TPR) repeat protein